MASRRSILCLTSALIAMPLLSQDSGGFLEPCRPHSEYDLVLVRTLIDTKPELWMIVKPSFQPESAIYLVSDSFGAENSTYHLHYAKARSPVWGMTLNKNAKVGRNSIPFPSHVAVKLIRTWETILKHTKYSDQAHGSDGIGFLFALKNRFFGQCWNPDFGEAKQISDLGFQLIEFIKSGPSERPTLLKRIEAQLELINSEAALSNQAAR